MLRNDITVEILMDLGLTYLQAKTYSTLTKLGNSTVKEISAVSNVARQDVYRILPILEKMGLVEKIIANPTMYKAISTKEGFFLLLENKAQEFSEVKQKTMDLIEGFHEKDCKVTLQEEEQFTLVSSKKLHWKKVETEFSKAQNRIDIMGKREGLMAWFFKNRQNTEKAIKKGVKIRVITEKGNKSIQSLSPIFYNNDLFEVRYVSSIIPIKTVIYDGNKLNMYIRPTHDNEITPSLWSSNTQLLKVITSYFEEIWDKSQTTFECRRGARNQTASKSNKKSGKFA